MRSRVYETVECLPVCPIDQQQQRRAAGLLLSAAWTRDIDRLLHGAPAAGTPYRQRRAANAGSVSLTADVGG